MQLLRLLALLGIFAMGVNTITPQKQVLITYPKDTPKSDLDDYKDAITSAGGEILHEFSLIKYGTRSHDVHVKLIGSHRGFIVKASTEAIDTIHTLSQEHAPTIEDDQTVTTQEQSL